jgi:hypothetical protein
MHRFGVCFAAIPLVQWQHTPRPGLWGPGLMGSSQLPAPPPPPLGLATASQHPHLPDQQAGRIGRDIAPGRRAALGHLRQDVPPARPGLGQSSAKDICSQGGGAGGRWARSRGSEPALLLGPRACEGSRHEAKPCGQLGSQPGADTHSPASACLAPAMVRSPAPAPRHLPPAPRSAKMHAHAPVPGPSRTGWRHRGARQGASSPQGGGWQQRHRSAQPARPTPPAPPTHPW